MAGITRPMRLCDKGVNGNGLAFGESVCLCVCLFVCFFVCLFVCLLVCLLVGWLFGWLIESLHSYAGGCIHKDGHCSVPLSVPGGAQAPRDGCTGTVTGAQRRLPRPPCRHAGVTGITARCRHLGLRDRAISKGRGGILWSGRVLLTRFHHMFVHLSGRGRV